MGQNPNFSEIVYEYEQNGGARLRGVFGLKPDNVVEFFEEKGYTPIIAENSKNYDIVSSVTDVTIAMFWNDKYDFTRGQHYVAFTRNDDGSINVYNYRSDSEEAKYFPTISDYLKDKKVVLYMGLKQRGL